PLGRRRSRISASGCVSLTPAIAGATSGADPTTSTSERPEIDLTSRSRIGRESSTMKRRMRFMHPTIRPASSRQHRPLPKAPLGKCRDGGVGIFLEELVRHRVADEVGDGGDAELFLDASLVRADGLDAEMEEGRDLGDALALDEVAEHFVFAVR